MITFKAMGQWGRLGNQMFQYATLYSVGKHNNYDIGIPYSVKTNNDYCNLFLDQCFDNLSAKDCSEELTLYDYSELYPDIRFSEKIFNVKDSTNLHGYFQTEKYFKQYKEDLLSEFRFSHNIFNKSKEIRNIIKDEVISLHIRIGDYKFLNDKHPICSYEYYKNAIEMLPKDKKIFLFSDEPDFAYSLLKKLSDNIIIPDTKNHFIDLCLMTMCDYHIIANSSFSWWGSWLSKSKKTIAPKECFGSSSEMPKYWEDIYCDGWSVI